MPRGRRYRPTMAAVPWSPRRPVNRAVAAPLPPNRPGRDLTTSASRMTYPRFEARQRPCPALSGPRLDLQATDNPCRWCLRSWMQSRLRVAARSWSPDDARSLSAWPAVPSRQPPLSRRNDSWSPAGRPAVPSLLRVSAVQPVARWPRRPARRPVAPPSSPSPGGPAVQPVARWPRRPQHPRPSPPSPATASAGVHDVPDATNVLSPARGF